MTTTNKKKTQDVEYESYLRLDKFPLIWCPGCGDGIVLKSMIRVIDKLGLSKDDVSMVSGIGCSSRLPGYVDFNTLHTTHGRPIAFATGVKLANPDLNVIVVTGDGDATAIGGNHFIHAARRNIDITVILFNNWIYGMTGGQASPTTPQGLRATTTPDGNPESSFDISGLAIAAGASYVARGSVTHPLRLDMYIQAGIQKKGFALIEAFTPCPTAFGRQNKMGSAAGLMEWLKESTVDVRKAKNMTEEELEGKMLTGVLTDIKKPEYIEQYDIMVERLSKDRSGIPAMPEREVVAASAVAAGGVKR